MRGKEVTGTLNFNDRIYGTPERAEGGRKSGKRKSWKLNKCATTKAHETDRRLLL